MKIITYTTFCVLFYSFFFTHLNQVKAESLLTEFSSFQIQLAKSGLSEFIQDIINEKYERVVDAVENQKVELNPKDISKGFPLLYAVLTNNPAIVSYLISRGAKVDTEIAGMTPLVFAVHFGLEKSVQLLLDADAKTNITVQGAKLIDIAYLRGRPDFVGELAARGEKISVDYKKLFEEPTPQVQVAKNEKPIDPFAGLVVSNSVLNLTPATENQKAGQH